MRSFPNDSGGGMEAMSVLGISLGLGVSHGDFEAWIGSEGSDVDGGEHLELIFRHFGDSKHDC